MEMKRRQNERRKETLLKVENSVSHDIKRCIDLAKEKAASSWLNVVPIEEQNFSLNKEEFRDIFDITSHCETYQRSVHATKNLICNMHYHAKKEASCHRDMIP